MWTRTDFRTAGFGCVARNVRRAFKFTVMGHIELEQIDLATRYGSMTLTRNDIISVVFREEPRIIRRFEVPGSTFAAANKWFSTDLELTKGQPLHITASGTLNLQNFGQTVGPEGTTNIGGNQFESFPTGSLVAKIGDKGKPFQVGSDFDGTANATGKIQFAISLQNGQVSGNFEVEVELEGEL